MNDRKIQNLCYEKWYRFVPIPNSTYSDKVASVCFPVVIVTQPASNDFIEIFYHNLWSMSLVFTVRSLVLCGMSSYRMSSSRDLSIQLYSTAKLHVKIFSCYASQMKMLAVIPFSIYTVICTVLYCPLRQINPAMFCPISFVLWKRSASTSVKHCWNTVIIVSKASINNITPKGIWVSNSLKQTF